MKTAPNSKPISTKRTGENNGGACTGTGPFGARVDCARACATVVGSLVAVSGMTVAVGVGNKVGVSGAGVAVLATVSANVGETAAPLINGLRAADAVAWLFSVSKVAVVALSVVLTTPEFVAVGIAKAGAGGNAALEEAADDAADDAGPADFGTLVGLGAPVGAASGGAAVG